MIVRSGRGIAVGTVSGALITNGNALEALSNSPAKFSSPNGSEDTTYQDIAMWGVNNRLPMEMLRDIEGTDVLSAGIDAKARISVGKGPMIARVTSVDDSGNETLTFVSDQPEAKRWLDVNNSFTNTFSLAKDLVQMGTAFFQILLNPKRDKIVAWKRHDPTECRFSKRDKETRRSEYVHISGDWDRYTATSDPEHYDTIPLLDRDYPLLDLQSRTEGHTFMVAIQYPLTGRQYYPPSPWFCARQWVKIAQGIPEMKEAMFRNQITLKYIVEIHEKFWEKYHPGYAGLGDDEQLEVQTEFYNIVEKYLTGGKNAYKSLFSTKIKEPNGEAVSAIEITELDDKIKDGKLLPDAAAANSEILFALMINPALLGVDIPGGVARTAGSGSNIREAYLVQVMLQELERRMISLPFVLARDYNGWDPQLELRFPNQVLTTLNTGANTQPIA